MSEEVLSDRLRDKDRFDWSEATNGIPWHKSIRVGFLEDMSGGVCADTVIDDWGRHQSCIRLLDHTGRHLATNYSVVYPTAVWR